MLLIINPIKSFLFLLFILIFFFLRQKTVELPDIDEDENIGLGGDIVQHDNNYEANNNDILLEENNNQSIFEEDAEK